MQNQTLYCICAQEEYGDMIACDNINCQIEWFHFGCVGISEIPNGPWFCMNCNTV